MKKILHNLVVFSLISNLIQPVYAIDLNTKLKNTDRSLFNTNPGVGIKDGHYMIFSEFSLSSNPMVLRNKNTGEVEPLVSSLMALDIGANYGLTSWMQVGFLLPLEKAAADKDYSYLSGPYFEAKFKILNNYALVPFYQLGSSNKINVDIGGNQVVPMGAPNGMYGVKAVGQWGNVMESYGFATQIGYASASENEFMTINQSSKIILGASAGMPLTSDINGVVEVSGQKYDTNFPIEVLGLVNVKTNDMNIQVGGGTGNVQGSGSNTFKAFVGVTMFFGGGSSSSSRSMLPVYRKNNNNNRPTLNRSNDEIKPMMEDGIDHQQGPDVMEPGQTEDPSIPDVNGKSIDNYYGRNLASENLDPEIMNALIDSEEATQVKEEDPLMDLVEPRAKKVKKTNEKSVIQQASEKTKAVLKKKLEEKPAVKIEVAQPAKKIETKPVVVAPTKVEVKVVEKAVVKPSAPAKVDIKIVEKPAVKATETKTVVAPVKIEAIKPSLPKVEAVKPAVVASPKVEVTKPTVVVAPKIEVVKPVVVVAPKVEETKPTPIVVETKKEELKVDEKITLVEPVEVKVVEKKEVKKVATKVKKDSGRMDKLPNGQKVKVFAKEVNQLPKEVGVIYMSEASFKAAVVKMNAEKEQGKELAKALEPKVLNVIKAPVNVDLKEEIPSTPVEIVTDLKTESTPILVKEKEVDPVIMISEHPETALEKQGTELPIVPVDVSKLGKKKEETTTPVVVEVKDEKKVEEKQNVSVDTVNLDIPEVTVSVQQRQQLKNQLTQEFNKISLEDGRKNLSEKVLQEQEKINEQISAKQKVEAELKAKQEADALAIKLANEEKDLKENAPLAEDKEAAPGQAATKDELKPVQISNKKTAKPIIIALPQAQLNAFVAGNKAPKLPAPESSGKKLNLLEENDGIEEANGPSYSFGEE